MNITTTIVSSRRNEDDDDVGRAHVETNEQT